MKPIIIVIGLPGSGKTFFCNQYKNDYTIFDDCKDLDQFTTAIDLYLNKQKIIISNPWFVLQDVQKKIIQTLIDKNVDIENDVQWIFFENNPQQCWQNVCFRQLQDPTDKREVKSFIKTYTKLYHIPTIMNNIILQKVHETTM